MTALLLALAVVMTARADEPKKCTSSAKECEVQIRQMLAGQRYLGVVLQDLKPGVQIKAIVPQSPAQRAELRAGDRVIAVNGKDMTKKGIHDFKELIDSNRTGSPRLWIIIQRNGLFQKIEARLEPMSTAQIDKIVAQHLAQSHTAQAGATRQ